MDFPGRHPLDVDQRPHRASQPIVKAVFRLYRRGTFDGRPNGTDSGHRPSWPCGNRIEIYTGGFLVLAPDFKPVIWNEETRGTGVYWGAPLPDSFLNYATPDADEGTAPAQGDIPVFDPH